MNQKYKQKGARLSLAGLYDFAGKQIILQKNEITIAF